LNTFRPSLARRVINALAEVGGAVVLGAVALVTLFFAWLGAEVGEGETRRFDTGILLALRHANDLAQPIGPHWLQAAMLDLTALGGAAVLTLLAILAIGLVLAQRKWAQAAFIGVALGGGGLLSGLLKIGYARPRPELVAHLVEVSSASFPSGHAMNSAVTYLTLSVLLARAAPERRVKIYILWTGVLLTLIVGCSRVYLGVHWPTDVLAGWAVGAAWAGLCWLVAERLPSRANRIRIRGD
jgi:undecaprenyl-diphosphatase